MRLPFLFTALLPLLAVAQSTASQTTTMTSTAVRTLTVTISEVQSVYATYPAFNSTISVSSSTVALASPTPASGIGGIVPTASPNPKPTTPSNFMGAANSLNAYWAGGAGLVVCAVAAML